MLKAAVKLLPVLSAAYLLFLNCSLGTETGNPGMTTCARSAFEPLLTVDQWLPSSYLVNGISQLDPGFIHTDLTETPSLAKKTISAEDQDSFTIVYRTDTVITIDTVYIVDTIVETSIKSDTVIKHQENSPDSSLVFSERLHNDSIFLVDTVIILDTVLVTRIDTIGIDKGPFDPIIVEVSPVTVTLSEYTPDSVIYLITRRTSQPAIRLVLRSPPITYRFDSSLISLSRKSTLSGMDIYEEYRDSDGDGMLYLSKTTASPRSTLFASYSRDNSGTELYVRFDAGQDNTFSSTSDNRILSLKRISMVDQMKIQEVLYGNEYVNPQKDTVTLSVEKRDNTKSELIRYTCIRGDDPDTHTENRLVKINYELSFTSGPLREIKIRIIPEVPLEAGQDPSRASMEAFINYGKGVAGDFQGIIDYSTGLVSGIYAEGGIEYEVEYRTDTDRLEQFPLK
ncbi:MAG TPA: hypothetical protein PLE24_09675 [Chitinispirillaceae bacterium]|nr:hypothetical protein [Chitinispirillaceae bacterium]